MLHPDRGALFRLLPSMTPLCYALALGACYKPVPPGAAVTHDVTPVTASFGRTWDAVIDVFAAKNIPIKAMERASGFISAEQASIPLQTREEADYALTLADCGSVGRIQLIPATATYNVVVRGDSARSTVNVSVKYLNYGARAPAMAGRGTNTMSPMARECATRGVFEGETEAAIKQRAEAR